jgi:enediyne biosynthesis protein E4
MRRHRLALVFCFLAFIITAGVYWALVEWRFRSDRDELRRDVARGFYVKARPGLIRLTERRPNDGELQYQLGVCEWGLGREEGAVRAWSRVPDGSLFSGQAAVRRARSELARHRLAAAEVLLPKALADQGDHSLEAFETLLTLYRIEGRFDEALRLCWSYADRYPDQIALLRELVQLGSIKAHKLDYTRGLLETASRAAPDDDRIWLGWANLAIRVGRFEEAARWLDRCERRRPDDVAVWRSRLNVALAAQDVDGAYLALGHLPAEAIEPAEILSLRAWFAELASDEPKERRALTELLTLEPPSFRGLDRLAELELRAGRSEEAARLRARKSELDRAMAQYDLVLSLPDASANAIQLAQLAETLGLVREARMLWAFARKRHPGDPRPVVALARLGRTTPRPPPTSSPLSALLAERAGGGPPAGRGQSSTPAAAQPVFVDDAESVGLKFVFENGANPQHLLSLVMGGGVALLDYDGDGWLDVYCVQGRSSLDTAKLTGGDRLFRNRGDGTFVDVSAASRIETMPRGYGHGVTVGDFDNDGRPDLFVTRMNSYALYHNRGDGTFEDVTQASGLGGARDWPTSAAFADLDGDGDLDLYVCHYAEWDSKNPNVCYDPATKNPVVCQPLLLRSRPDHLFRNDGGKFVDVTTLAGVVDTHGEGLGVVACDLDKDGRVDLFVANDQSANFLFRNLGGFRFEEVGAMSGVGSSADGLFQANMGIACGDSNGDGLPDLVVTEFYNEGATYYQNLGGGVFSDHSVAVGLKAPTRSMLGFGIVFFDYDSNGLLDLAIANGHVDDYRPSAPYQMPCQLLAGTRNGKFVDVTSRAGPPWQVLRVARGLASGDLDNDGRVDLVVLSHNQPLAFFHNKTAGGHWLTLRLEGTASNRDAVGASVTVTAGGRRQTSWRVGGGSFQSASDPRLHFGLGAAGRVDQVEVAWPSGRVERFDGVSVDTGYLLREGDGRPKPLPGFAR